MGGGGGGLGVGGPKVIYWGHTLTKYFLTSILAVVLQSNGF